VPTITPCNKTAGQSKFYHALRLIINRFIVFRDCSWQLERPCIRNIFGWFEQRQQRTCLEKDEGPNRRS
jgi:hypothetical protein